MRILTIASQKGGAGKTTLTAHLAVEAGRAGAGPVAVVDTDPQGSLSAWWNTRQADTPLFAALDMSQLAAHLQVLQDRGIQVVLIDTPPALTSIIERTIAAAHFVLIPARPSPHDLRAVATIVEMVEYTNTPFCFVLNGATPRTTIARDAIGALAAHGKVAPVTLHQRIDFASSMIDGHTAVELEPQSRSGEEIAALWVYVAKELRKYERRPTHGQTQGSTA
jgi:chromosome partitioning protein